MLSRIRYHWQVISVLPWEEKVDYLLASTKRVFNDETKITEEDRAMKSALADRFQEVKEASRLAALRYQPRPYSGRITLFRATLVRHPDPKLNWGPLAGGGLEIHDIPAPHAILAREGSVRVVSRKLRDCLNRVQQITD